MTTTVFRRANSRQSYHTYVSFNSDTRSI